MVSRNCIIGALLLFCVALCATPVLGNSVKCSSSSSLVISSTLVTVNGCNLSPTFAVAQLLTDIFHVASNTCSEAKYESYAYCVSALNVVIDPVTCGLSSANGKPYETRTVSFTGLCTVLECAAPGSIVFTPCTDAFTDENWFITEPTAAICAPSAPSITLQRQVRCGRQGDVMATTPYTTPADCPLLPQITVTTACTQFTPLCEVEKCNAELTGFIGTVEKTTYAYTYISTTITYDINPLITDANSLCACDPVLPNCGPDIDAPCTDLLTTTNYWDGLGALLPAQCLLGLVTLTRDIFCLRKDGVTIHGASACGSLLLDTLTAAVICNDGATCTADSGACDGVTPGLVLVALKPLALLHWG
jgi:hypothetical protein